MRTPVSYDPRLIRSMGSWHFLFQNFCNQLQLASGRRGRAALATVSADLEAGYDDVEAAVTLNLPLQPVEEIALEFRDLATAQAGHVNVVPLRATFVVVFLTFQVHQIKFVDQAVALEQLEGPVHRNPVDLRIEPAGMAQDLTGVEMLLGSFPHA